MNITIIKILMINSVSIIFSSLCFSFTFFFSLFYVFLEDQQINLQIKTVFTVKRNRYI